MKVLSSTLAVLATTMRRKAVAIVFVVVGAALHGAAPHAQARVLERLSAGRDRAEARGVQGVRAADAPDVRVLRRELLGRYIEDIDYVPNGSGPFSKHIVMLNGFEVHGLPAAAGSNAPIRKLFDLRQQAMVNPTGIAYVPSESLFAVIDGDGPFPKRLFFMDHHGRPKPSREIRFLEGYWPDHMEGLAYVPSTSPRFPNHLLTITWAWWDEQLARVQVVRPDGQVVAQIPVPDSYSRAYGVAYRAPDQILVSGDVGLITTLDFDGNVLRTIDTEDFIQEGVVELADARVVIGASAQLRFYDAALNRLPQHDRDGSTPIGVVLTTSVAWDPDRLQHLVAGRSESIPWFEVDHVAAAPVSLNAGTVLFPLISHAHGVGIRTARMTYTPDEHRIVASLLPSSGPQEVAVFDDEGTVVEWIDASAIGPTGVAAVKMSYVPSTREFVMVANHQRSRLKFLTRTGVLAREIDLAPIGIHRISAVAYFNPLHPSGGQFLVFDPDGRAVVTDFAGNLMSEFDYRAELGLMSVGGASAITNGPQAGAFTAFESASSPTLVVFTLE